MSLKHPLFKPFSWVWLFPASLIAVAAFAGATPLTALGIGLAAGLSLSGSI